MRYPLSRASTKLIVEPWDYTLKKPLIKHLALTQRVLPTIAFRDVICIPIPSRLLTMRSLAIVIINSV
jgi:hypothetical protein